MNCSLDCASTGAVEDSITALSSADNNKTGFFIFVSFMRMAILRDSIRERPDTHFLLADRPQLGQTMRLHDQEPHDQATKNHQFGVRHHRG